MVAVEPFHPPVSLQQKLGPDAEALRPPGAGVATSGGNGCYCYFPLKKGASVGVGCKEGLGIWPRAYALWVSAEKQHPLEVVGEGDAADPGLRAG